MMLHEWGITLIAIRAHAGAFVTGGVDADVDDRRRQRHRRHAAAVCVLRE
ncbi:hypothetical protein M8494_37920 [Serratia ureilytica]